jgi:hypothetical protein
MPQVQGFSHVSLSVPEGEVVGAGAGSGRPAPRCRRGAEELDAWTEHLDEPGVRHSPMVERDDGDPDEFPLELSHREHHP